MPPISRYKDWPQPHAQELHPLTIMSSAYGEVPLNAPGPVGVESNATV